MDLYLKENQLLIKQAIQKAEFITSGEIRVCVDKKCTGDSKERAVYYFKHLNMHKTELRNGVLIYIALESRKIAIIGDAGINKFASSNFWEETKNIMIHYFKQDDIITGLVKGIENAGKLLAENYPYQRNDINELSDEIYFGDQ